MTENYPKAVESTTEKLYRRFDLQNQTDFEIETLEQMKEWLARFWNHNPDDDMTDEEHDELIEGIMKSDVDELLDRMSGIDYWFEEVDTNEGRKE